VRVLVICALALAVAGCSRQPPPQSAVPCVDLKGAACAGQPIVSPPPGRDAARHGRHAPASSVRRRHRSAHHHARIALAEPSRSPHALLPRERPQASQLGPTKPAAADRGTLRDDPNIRLLAGAKPLADAKPAADNKSPAGTKAETSKVQEQVGVAANLAERMTAIGAKPAVPVAKDRTDGRLVAVLMARPNVKAISDLRGKSIAIDERYAASIGKVATAIEAAGAPGVQLVDGRGTAINRLTNGEVAAAVVALVSPEAADAFPQLAGFRLFQVPLSAL
jgi:hypothetical protein